MNHHEIMMQTFFQVLTGAQKYDITFFLFSQLSSSKKSAGKKYKNVSEHFKTETPSFRLKVLPCVS